MPIKIASLVKPTKYFSHNMSNIYIKIATKDRTWIVLYSWV